MVERDRRAGRAGRVEKMSKSKKNTVDPEPIVDHYGADAVRWFMLSDSPPERDLPGARPGSRAAGASSSACGGCREDERGGSTWLGDGDDRALDRKLHQTIAAVGANIEALAFNKAVAQHLRAGQCDREGAAFGLAQRGDRDHAVLLVAPMVPHLAEEAWAALGETG